MGKNGKRIDAPNVNSYVVGIRAPKAKAVKAESEAKAEEAAPAPEVKPEPKTEAKPAAKTADKAK